MTHARIVAPMPQDFDVRAVTFVARSEVSRVAVPFCTSARVRYEVRDKSNMSWHDNASTMPMLVGGFVSPSFH